jgi:hypothetical protein
MAGAISGSLPEARRCYDSPMTALLLLLAQLSIAAPAPFHEPTLPELRAKLANAEGATETFNALDGIARFNSAATPMEPDAGKLAQRLLKQAASMRTNWNYPNAVHHANLVLGRVSLAKGNLNEARAYLLRAADVKGSPQLSSFGPNLTLASELLAKGDKATVLKYLNRCRKFWGLGADKTAAWKQAIAVGAKPDFGANLRF